MDTTPYLTFRLRIINDMDLPELGNDMVEAITEIQAAWQHKNALLSQYRELQADVEVRKADLLLSVDGKNAEQRAAQLILALDADLAYRDMAGRSADIKSDMDTADATMEVARMRYGAAKARLAAATAALQVIGMNA